MASIVQSRQVSSHARWLVLLLGVAVFINYVDRGNLATAGPLLKTELKLSNTAFGLLISAFFWVYAPAQLLAGWAAQRFCAYRVLAAGIALWAAATVATGFAGGFLALLVLRLLLGLGEAAMFPCASKLITDHVPPECYGQANSATALGLSIGPAFGTYVGGLMMAHYGWRPSFIVFGALSLLWLLPWLRLRRDTARPHAALAPAPSLLGIARRRPAIATALGHFCVNYSFYFMLAWLPVYLVKVHGYSIEGMAAVGGLLYLVEAVSALLFGYLPDRWIAAGASTNLARKVMMTGGTLINATALVAAAFGDARVALGALFVTKVFGGMTGSNIYATGQTLAGPAAAGKWIGLQNAVGNIAGIVAPLLAGWLLDRNGDFTAAFLVAAAISLAGAFCWSVMIGRIAPLDWPGVPRAGGTR